MKLFFFVSALFLSFQAIATNDMYASNFVIRPRYMNIDSGAPILLGDIAFEARFIPENKFCGIYYKNVKIDCVTGTRNFGAELGFFIKAKIVSDLLKSELTDSSQKTRSLEILNLIKPDDLILIGEFAKPLGEPGFVWKFYENAIQFSDPQSKTEVVTLNAEAENLRKL